MMPIVQLTFPTADSTGTQSLYTTFKDYELMFHVSTLLPYTPNNKQQVRMESSTRRPSAEKDARLDVHIKSLQCPTDRSALFFNHQLLRKRHIGNDIVTIVFQEPGAHPFTPKVIRSHFQHVFIIVRVHNPCSDSTCYRWVFAFSTIEVFVKCKLNHRWIPRTSSYT